MLRLPRLAVTAVCALSITGLAACGEEHEVKKGESEGIYVTVDHLKYQVQISRILNQTDAEDRSYIEALGATADKDLGPGEEWFGVFLRVENEGDDAQVSSRDIRIEDTTGAEFEPLPLDGDSTPLAYFPANLEPTQEIPSVGSIAQTTTTAGALLLFKLPRQNLENRPLELIIKGEGAPADEARVDLDV
ncbi:hypothetical protein [Conexibacter sp. SYSU D00693]|uniref:hypothetical protein n=1 Tax=Conexibacter sp. SYSU D00693 TaxID=2812560 RepID=UPI00196A5E39|nr:hypothetical protein [Conexibacter sp. SYSU D00693]